MDELESQIAKIQLGNFKRTSSFVYALTEKAAGSQAELYLVAELPLLNPAAEDSCEKICSAAAAALKRAYKKPLTPNSFETAIAQINDELGKLASLGQIHWINKLNCVIAVKNGHDFTIASCGKVAGYLFRAGEFTDISCSPAQSHPLKTFENYSVGKIRLGDLLILSTTQLFNYIALDRLKTIFLNGEFLQAARTIVELLKGTAGPETAFGTILNLQIEPGQAPDERLDLENYLAEPKQTKTVALVAAWNYLKSMIPADKNKRRPQIGLPGLSQSGVLAGLSGNAKIALAKSKSLWNALGRGAAAGRTGLRPENLKNISPEKKFFLISLGVLLITVVLCLGVAIHLKKQRARDTALTGRLKQVQNLLNDAQTSLLYNDQASAQNYLAQAESKMPGNNTARGANLSLYQSVNNQLADLENKIQKQSKAQVANLGALAFGAALIKLPNLLAVQSPAGIISYSLTTGRVEDGALKAGDNIIANVYIGNNNSAVFNGGALRLWDFTTGKLSAPFSANLPVAADFAGLAWYPANNRVYLVDKKAGQIKSFAAHGGAFSRPVVSVSDDSLKTAWDLTIDGAIYVLNGDGVKKFQSGSAADFKPAALVKPLSGGGKIYTQKDFQNLYILDIGNSRIVILSKKGRPVAVLTSDKFTKLVDFAVDEKNKLIYVLNDSSLLKVAIP